ncbi:Cysteine-rich secretory protein family protein [Luteibacter sp. OK325]|uniref:CAP domain-containing protein n=1 Tax=Luteibacter sp. OK325 TaxID=2135670 RepID=UPI000D3A2713|nr:CAP domain-containing protein [Luteibacter sp. OK325]PTR25509.1 Cysteine-rich secretory protein family protein [Luteibacter sp. OK325]
MIRTAGSIEKSPRASDVLPFAMIDVSPTGRTFSRHRFLSFGVFFFLVATPVAIPQAARAAVSQATAQSLVDAVNKIRREQFDTPPVTYSTSLQSDAQQWAEHCVYDYSSSESNGETLAFLTSPTPLTHEVIVAKAIDLWGAEIVDYDYSTGSVSPGKLAPNWTQIVWRTTRQVGLGIASCSSVPGLPTAGYAYIVDAQWDEPGNVLGEYSENVGLPTFYAEAVHSAANGGTAPPPLTTPLLVLGADNAVGFRDGVNATVLLTGNLTLDFGTTSNGGVAAGNLVVYTQGLDIDARVDFFDENRVSIGQGVLRPRATVNGVHSAMAYPPTATRYRYISLSGVGIYGVDAVSAVVGTHDGDPGFVNGPQ